MFGPTLYMVQAHCKLCSGNAKSWFLTFLDSPRCTNEKIRESRISKGEKREGKKWHTNIGSKVIELSSFITYSQLFIIKIRQKYLEDVGECIPIL